jgi:HK97 gp10 family phage protein
MKEFKSLMDFSAFMKLAVPIAIAAELRRGLEASAKAIEETAKAEIGKYQPEIGPFPEWPELAESTQQDRERQGYPANEPLLRRGDLRDSIERQVGNLEAVIGSKSEIAAYQEFGTDKIPARPFMGPAAFRNKDKIAKAVGAAVVSGLFGGGRIHQALGYDMDVNPE